MRALAIAKRCLIESFRDKRTLALIFIGPIVVLWLMNVMFSANSTASVSLGLVKVNQTVKKNIDNTKHVTVKKYKTETEAKQVLKAQKIDGIISYSKQKNKYNVTYANTDSTKTNLTKQVLRSALIKQNTSLLTKSMKKMQLNLAKMEPMIKQINPQFSVPSPSSNNAHQPKIANHYAYGNKDTNFFAKIIPLLMGFFIFLFVFLISGMGLLNERVSGTLDRMLATPVKRSDIILGYMISYGLITILQSIVIVLTTINLLHVEVTGSVLNIIIISLILALVALSFGLLLSTLASSEFQFMQFMPVVVVPQVFFSGIIPLSSMAPWVQNFGKVLPLTYAGDALTSIIFYGTSIFDLGNDILALLIFLIILVALNIIGLKRYRKV